MASVSDLSDVDLYERWEWERVQDEHPPNEVLVASLEREARSRGFELKDVVYSLGITAARIFDPDLHPRGLDGRFIEKLGLVELFGLPNSKDGRRGQVVDITPDPKSPGRPTIKVRIDDPNTGKAQMFVDVKPDNIKQAPKPKAKLDHPIGRDSNFYAGEGADLPYAGPGRQDVPAAPTGAGTKDDPIKTSDVTEAAQALGEGKYVELDQISSASVLLDEIRKMTDDAKAKGDTAPTYDLCKASVAGTNLFCAETKNIPRIRMPQLKTDSPQPGTLAATLPLDDRGEADGAAAFVDYLRGRGIDVTEDVVPADTLRPSQNELNGAKVAGIMNFIEGGGQLEGKIFVTSDDYVVDGHHRWAAQIGAGIVDENNLDIAVDRIDAPILQVLAIANNWTTANGFPHADVGPNLKEADVNAPDVNAPGVSPEDKLTGMRLDTSTGTLDSPDTPLNESNDVDRLTSVWQDGWDPVAKTTTGPSQSDEAFGRLDDLGMLTPPDASAGGSQDLTPEALTRRDADAAAREGGGTTPVGIGDPNSMDALAEHMTKLQAPDANPPVGGPKESPSAWGPDIPYAELSKKLEDAGADYNPTLKNFKLPDGSTLTVDHDYAAPNYKEPVSRFSVYPPGLSYWSTDQSSVRRYNNVDDALASVAGTPDANAPATPNAPDVNAPDANAPSDDQRISDADARMNELFAAHPELDATYGDEYRNALDQADSNPDENTVGNLEDLVQEAADSVGAGDTGAPAGGVEVRPAPDGSGDLQSKGAVSTADKADAENQKMLKAWQAGTKPSDQFNLKKTRNLNWEAERQLQAAADTETDPDLKKKYKALADSHKKLGDFWDNKVEGRGQQSIGNLTPMLDRRKKTRDGIGGEGTPSGVAKEGPTLPEAQRQLAGELAKQGRIPEAKTQLTEAAMNEKGAHIEGDQVVGAPGDYQGSTVKLLDGGDSPIGTRVKSVKDGKAGEVVGYDKNDGYIKVKYDGDPKTYARSKRTLMTENNRGQISLEPSPGGPPTAELSKVKSENFTDQQLIDEIDHYNKMADRPGGLTVPEGKYREALVIEHNQRQVTTPDSSKGVLKQPAARTLQTTTKSSPSAPSKPKAWSHPDIQKQLKETQQSFNEDGVQYSVPDLLDTRRDQVGDEIAYARANGNNFITLKPPSGTEQQIPLELAESWAVTNGVQVPAAPLA